MIYRDKVSDYNFRVGNPAQQNLWIYIYNLFITKVFTTENTIDLQQNPSKCNLICTLNSDNDCILEMPNFRNFCRLLPLLQVTNASYLFVVYVVVDTVESLFCSTAFDTYEVE